jgi:hypothetical protein
MPKSVWTISGNDVTGGAFGSALTGCHITTNDAGTAYEFIKGSNVLATTTGATLPTGSFDFPAFTLSGPTFGVHVDSVSTNQVSGSWTASANDDTKETDPENGNWTAQAGSGTPEDEPGIAASTTA